MTNYSSIWKNVIKSRYLTRAVKTSGWIEFICLHINWILSHLWLPLLIGLWRLSQLRKDLVILNFFCESFLLIFLVQLGKGVIYSIIAGLFAALASVFGKLALDPNFMRLWLAELLDDGPDSSFSLVSDPYSGRNSVLIIQILYSLKLVCMGGIVASNAILWNFLGKFLVWFLEFFFFLTF